MGRLLALILTILTISGCKMIEEFGGQPEMTSPCVGTDDSPCGPKRPVNMWLYQHNDEDVA